MDNNILILIGCSFNILSGIYFFVHPESGSKLLASIRWTEGLFVRRSTPKEQNIARPSIVRLLGAAFILSGLFILSKIY
jgi:hypothetical protein